MKLYIGLVHYPVYNKHYETIASAVTTFDLHDVARVARTYDIKKYFVITPLEDQQQLVERVKRHWTEGFGASYNRNRKEAIELVSVVPTMEAAFRGIDTLEGESPLLISTDASRQEGRSISFPDLRRMILDREKVVLLLFGTAWGLHKTLMAKMDYVLDPVEGRSGYQHLSVRAASAIIIDRLVGRR